MSGGHLFATLKNAAIFHEAQSKRGQNYFFSIKIVPIEQNMLSWLFKYNKV